MPDGTRIALIAGASGVVGRNLLAHLAKEEDWRIVALSRRPPDVEGQYRHIAVDLSDPADCRAKLGHLTGITHIFFSAYVEKPSPENPDWAAMVEPNLAMLRNLLDAVEPVAAGLEHVHLMEGTKWYGSHLGPFRTPARESDPRHMPPNFYYDQQDLLETRSATARWSWSAARPHSVCGFAVGNPMNLVMLIAVYAAISKALGLPLRHPGSRANAGALFQVTDSALLARASTWMATEPGAANEAFNITNGDIFRWETLWPAIARFFDMETAPPQRLDLVRMMADKAPLWERLTREHGLKPIPFQDLVSWRYGNAVFASEYDIISSLTKIRQRGFTECVDSEKMFLDQFRRLREAQVIP